MPQYLISLLNKLSHVLISLFILYTGPNLVWGQTLFTTLENSNQISKESYPKLIKKFSNLNFELKNIKDINKVIFHPAFINTLIFYNKGNVLNLGINDRCSLIDLLSTDLLYSPTGKLTNVLIKFENQKGKIEIHALPKQKFLLLIGYKQCPKSQDLPKYFTTRNLRKTLKDVSLKIPNSEMQCKKFRQDFLADVKAPFLCDITHKVNTLNIKKIQLRNTSKSNYRKYETLKKEVDVATSYKKILNQNSLLYLTRFCEHSALDDQFCEEVFKINYWTNSIKQAKDDTAIKYYCGQVYPKGNLDNQRLKNCANRFAEQKRNCEMLGNDKTEIFPKPFCDELSVTLNNSRLFQSYVDCPARSGSDSLTLASRVLMHLDQQAPSTDQNNCEAYHSYPYAKFNQEFLESLLWQVNVCFDDKIQRKKVCYPTLLNEVEDSDLSLSKNIEKILTRLRGFNPETQSCKVINEESYRPQLLEFKTGCFILKDFKNCNGTNCKFRVIFDDRPFDKYTFEQDLHFDLLPFRYTEENKSFISLIERYKKKRVREIINISTFMRIFEEHQKAIFVGLGCAQDLLPNFFKVRSVNQCTILPFIVDGILEDNGRYSMVTRTSYDHIHAPRLIPWTYIFSAIKNYQTHHPLNTWGFYAIY